jgi:hypothetical protein
MTGELYMPDNEGQLNQAIIALQCQLENVNMQLLQLHRQKNSMERREKERTSKARTRRLIQIGAIAEKYLNANGMSVEEIEILLGKIVHIEEINSMLLEQSVMG